MWFPVVAVCIWSLGDYVIPVDSSHFMGGLIYWKPVNPAEFDGRVQIIHRVTIKGAYCTQASATFGASQLVCQSGCSGRIGTSTLSCTDLMTNDSWSTGEQTYTHMFSRIESHFEALYSDGAWISLINIGLPGGEFRVRGNQNYRRDTGLINSSPVVNTLPLVRLQHGCSHIIKIQAEDPDGDHVHCRWAESYLRECGWACRNLPANLNGRDCEIQYTASNLTGDYAVAIQVEDFMSPMDITPMSSVPVQFAVRVQDILSNPPCSSQPEFIDTTPSDGACFGVPFNTSWRAIISAKVSNRSTATSISNFVTASPLGMRKSDLIPSSIDSAAAVEWQMSVTWTPLEAQLGPNIFCFAALDSIGLQSAHRCVTLLAGVEPPMIIPGSMSPTGEIFANQSLWSVQFDKKFTRPMRDTYIRIYGEKGEQVFFINVRTSADVTYPTNALDHTLIFSINNCQLQLPVNQTFYIHLDEGVAVGAEFCHAQSPPMTDPTLWTFMTVEDTEIRKTSRSSIEAKEENCITIATVCTIFAFIIGIISGLTAYHYISALFKKKAKQQSTSSSLQIGVSNRITHYDRGENKEASGVYEEVNYESETPNLQVELKENIAYGQF